MRRNPKKRSGFTMIEIVVGLFILTIGALGYALVTAGLARAFLLDSRRARASQILTTQNELLLRQGCSSQPGSAVRFGMPVEWSVSGGPSTKNISTSVTRSGVTGSKRDSLTVLVPCS